MTMHEHLTVGIRDSVVGVVGTTTSLTLVEWNAVIGIVVGLMTGIYMTYRIFLVHREWVRGRTKKFPAVTPEMLGK